jgi:hypothetical protein
MNTSRLYCLPLVLFIGLASLFDEPVDLKKLTNQCLQAAGEFVPITKNYPYKVLHTVNYTGWCGDTLHTGLRHPIEMRLTYAGNSKKGAYWYKAYPENVIKISARSDQKGNLEIKQHIQTGKHRYVFHGIMKNGELKGCWVEKTQKRSFAFYLKAIQTENLP